MNIRKTIGGGLAMAAALLAFSCSDIAESDRLVYVPPQPAHRAIIVEDFTGQRCPNCPTAALAIEELQKQYSADTVIAVGIYSGPFGHVGSRPLSLTTTTGESYYDRWGFEAQPSVLFNRQGGAESDGSKFAAIVSKQLSQTTPVELKLTTDYDAASSKVKVNVEGASSENLDTKLQVWVLEDSIIDLQTMPTGQVNRTYVHNHVFRMNATSDIWGDNFKLTTTGSTTASYDVELDKSWKPEQLWIVAFVYNDANGVYQAVRAKVVGAEAAAIRNS